MFSLDRAPAYCCDVRGAFMSANLGKVDVDERWIFQLNDCSMAQFKFFHVTDSCSISACVICRFVFKGVYEVRNQIWPVGLGMIEWHTPSCLSIKATWANHGRLGDGTCVIAISRKVKRLTWYHPITHIPSPRRRKRGMGIGQDLIRY